MKHKRGRNVEGLDEVLCRVWERSRPSVSRAATHGQRDRIIGELYSPSSTAVGHLCDDCGQGLQTT